MQIEYKYMTVPQGVDIFTSLITVLFRFLID